MRRLLRLSLFLPAIALSASCQDRPDQGEAARGPFPEASAQVAEELIAEAVASINEADFYSRIGFLAHDSLGGRDTPSPGLEMAAAWAAEEFAGMGLEPGGDDGSYIQRWEYSPGRGAE
ncbi:MAG: hypothetical protein HKO65_13085, partial [Gemmatimonadetes bacterium]|nr:hypothetical protein [Gemmatimonadota bacterium]